MDKILEPFAQFGLAGLVIAALMAFVVFIHKHHKDERKEWREHSGKISERQVDVQKDTNTVIRELTAVIREGNRHR